VVAEYAMQMRAGAVFPPVLVFDDGRTRWLADGYHRTAAREVCGQQTVLAELRPGGCAEAVWAACASNITHGLRRSNADKRMSVIRALSHPRAQRLSDRQIGQHCGVHHQTVGRIRRELEERGVISGATVRDVVRGDSHYQQRTNTAEASTRSRGTDPSLHRDRLSPMVAGACPGPEDTGLQPRDGVDELAKLLRRAEALMVRAAKQASTVAIEHDAVRLRRHTERVLLHLKLVQSRIMRFESITLAPKHRSLVESATHV
jgi:hypothetical protein